MRLAEVGGQHTDHFSGARDQRSAVNRAESGFPGQISKSGEERIGLRVFDNHALPPGDTSSAASGARRELLDSLPEFMAEAQAGATWRASPSPWHSDNSAKSVPSSAAAVRSVSFRMGSKFQRCRKVDTHLVQTPQIGELLG